MEHARWKLQPLRVDDRRAEETYRVELIRVEATDEEESIGAKHLRDRLILAQITHQFADEEAIG